MLKVIREILQLNKVKVKTLKIKPKVIFVVDFAIEKSKNQDGTDLTQNSYCGCIPAIIKQQLCSIFNS